MHKLFDTPLVNRAVQSQKMSRGLKLVCTFYVVKTNVLISYAVTAQLICAFVLAYAKIRFSHAAAQSYAMIMLSWNTGV